jgi:hypothetical protein
MNCLARSWGEAAHPARVRDNVRRDFLVRRILPEKKSKEKSAESEIGSCFRPFLERRPLRCPALFGFPQIIVDLKISLLTEAY